MTILKDKEVSSDKITTVQFFEFQDKIEKLEAELKEKNKIIEKLQKGDVKTYQQMFETRFKEVFDKIDCKGTIYHYLKDNGIFWNDNVNHTPYVYEIEDELERIILECYIRWCKQNGVNADDEFEIRDDFEGCKIEGVFFVRIDKKMNISVIFPLESASNTDDII
ncbi:MAG: hypothetical protein HUJ68_12500 [Clostridia bacterium]|nr:hypothetical protein [Clostridia bacterium]